MEPKIIYEEKEWAAIFKPAGLQMHHARAAGASDTERATLADWLSKRYPETREVGDDPGERPGIVHRLDRDTSGIVLIARSQNYFSYLKSLFQEKKISKTYLALVRGHIRENSGTIDKAIGIILGSTKRSVRSDKMSKSALTDYKVLERLKNEEDLSESTLAEFRPRTGRTHQIRVHSAHIGHPVWGDKIYGPKKQPEWVTRLMLHARTLEFEVQEGKRMKLEAAPDDAFIRVYEAAGGGALEQVIHNN